MHGRMFRIAVVACQLLLIGIGATSSGLLHADDEDLIPVGWKRITHDGFFKERPIWSADGKKLLFSRHIDNEISVIQCDADGSNEVNLLPSPQPRFGAAWLPDGKRVVFTFDKITPGQGDMELYVADLEGKELQPIFITQGRLSHEEWGSPSPAGNWIACTSTRDDNSELYLVQSDGKETRRLTNDPALDVHPSFSPDGQRIAFATNRWGDLEIAIYDLQTSLITRLTESRGLDDYPVWSPDGSQIAWTSRRDGNLEIYVMQADGSNPRNVTQNETSDNFPAWTPQGEITFSSFQNGAWDLFVVKP